MEDIRASSEQLLLIKNQKKVVILGDERALDGILYLLQEEWIENNETGFWNNRCSIFAAYKRQEFFVVKMIEDDYFFYHQDCLIELQETLFNSACGQGGGFLYRVPNWLPAFYTTVNSSINIIWVHPAFRRLGLGKLMVGHANCKEVDLVLPASIPFWTANGVTYLRVCGDGKNPTPKE